jgi:hypothetical protein
MNKALYNQFIVLLISRLLQTNITLCAVVFLGLWVRLVLGIHDLEDQREVPCGPYPPFS